MKIYESDSYEYQQSNASIVAELLTEIITPDKQYHDHWHKDASFIIQYVIAHAYDEDPSFWAVNEVLNQIRIGSIEEMLLHVNRNFSAREQLTSAKKLVQIYANARRVSEMHHGEKNSVIATARHLIQAYCERTLMHRIKTWNSIIKTITHPE